MEKNNTIKNTTTEIDSSAFVDASAQIGEGVKIEKGAIIGPEVVIESGTKIGSNAIITGKTKIGNNNIFFPNTFIGFEPQDLKYRGANTELIIGDNNTFRECVTINKATYEGEKTIIGNNNLLMAYTHIGHNCDIGNNTVLSNSVQVAGHVKIEDNAIIGGCLGIHQFVHVGYLAMVGGMTRVDRDVPPFTLAEGHPGRLRGLNRVGIKRSGLIENNLLDQKLLQKIWNLLFKSDYVLSHALDLAMKEKLDDSSKKLCNFVKNSISKNRRGPMPVTSL